MENVSLLIIVHLCCDIILSLTLTTTICVLNQANIDPPTLFTNLTENVHPIACSSRKLSEPEAAFILKTVKILLTDGIIRPSNSPWRV
jgi:hypothetical protein